jgi:hypothetical protein
MERLPFSTSTVGARSEICQLLDGSSAVDKSEKRSDLQLIAD